MSRGGSSGADTAGVQPFRRPAARRGASLYKQRTFRPSGLSAALVEGVVLLVGELNAAHDMQSAPAIPSPHRAWSAPRS